MLDYLDTWTDAIYTLNKVGVKLGQIVTSQRDIDRISFEMAKRDFRIVNPKPKKDDTTYIEIHGVPVVPASLEASAIRGSLRELEAGLESIGSCGDGNCIVLKQNGQHTNGGCRCSTDRIRMQKYAYYQNRFTSQIKEILGKQEQK